MPVSKKRKTGRAPKHTAKRVSAGIYERRLTLPFSHPLNVHALTKVFGPTEAILDQIETGESHVTATGEPVFWHTDDKVFYPIATLESMCDTFDNAALDAGVETQTEGFRKLLAKLHYGMTVDERDTQAARSSVAWMRAIARTCTPRDMQSYMLATQVKAEFEARKP